MKYLHHFETNDEFHANYDMDAEAENLTGYYEPWASYTDENTTQTEITGFQLQGFDGTYRYAGEYMFIISGTLAFGYAPLWTNGTDYVFINITPESSGGGGGSEEPIVRVSSSPASSTVSSCLVPTSDLSSSIINYAAKVELVNINNTLYIDNQSVFTPNITTGTTTETTKNMAYNKYKDRIFVTYDGTNEPVVDSATPDIKHAAIYVNNVYQGIMDESMSITLSDGTEMNFGINPQTGDVLVDAITNGGGGVEEK